MSFLFNRRLIWQSSEPVFLKNAIGHQFGIVQMSQFRSLSFLQKPVSTIFRATEICYQGKAHLRHKPLFGIFSRVFFHFLPLQ